VVNFWTIHTHRNDRVYKIIDWQKTYDGANPKSLSQTYTCRCKWKQI